MSASCQSIDSMFEVRPIGTRTKFKPVKKPTSEIPSVELVTELVEVELEELRFYVMVSVQYAPLGVADDNVHPGQDFPDALFVIRNDSLVRGYHPVLFKGGIAAEPVRGHIGIPVRTLLNFTRNGGRLEIVDDLHLYMPDTLGRTVHLGRRRLWQAAFRHDKDRGLALASPSALQRAIFLFFRRFRGEEALVNLHIPMEGGSLRRACPLRHATYAPSPIRAGNACGQSGVVSPWPIWHAWSPSEGTWQQTSHGQADGCLASPYRNEVASHVCNPCTSRTCGSDSSSGANRRIDYSTGRDAHGNDEGLPHRMPRRDIDGKNQAGS